MAPHAFHDRRGRHIKACATPTRRGGLRSPGSVGGRTRDQLYDEARRRNIQGRSRMTREQLLEAIGRQA